ncbi:MAG: alpha-amylase family glycosyl hydrolase [Rubrivivax sp.]
MIITFAGRIGCWLALGAATAALAAAHAADAPLRLHVPSPDWRDQVLYFVMTDRFDDGDPSNNDQGAGEYRAGSAEHYNGGDFAGLLRRLDYVQGLGVTGVWITPPVLNQWWNGNTGHAGYHGYWAADFARVDPHLGTLDDYRRVSDALHRRGMTLVQDIVVNHMGDFFDYRGGWSPRDPGAHWQANEGSRPLARPSQPPFDANDPRDPTQRARGIYHWTPDVRDYGDRRQVLSHQMSGLDDLNTEHPEVRRALRASHGHWIREVGVDGFRVDTAFYVPEAFFDDFLHARDAQAPGIDAVARATGRQAFYTFGEGFALDRPGRRDAMRRIEAYATAPGGRPRLTGMLNFPLYGSLGDVFARGAPPAELGARIAAVMRVHRDPHRMATFVDNHDVDRFLAGGSEAALKQALLAMLTLPGVPVLYYGTEQGFTVQRAAMFAAGHASGGRDRFDTEAPLYRYLQRAVALRRGSTTLSRGRPQLLHAESAGPGVIAWRMQPEPGSAEPPLLVLINSADRVALVDSLPLGVGAGAALPLRFAIDGTPAAPRTGADGTLTVELPARAGWVLELPAPATAAPRSDPARPRISALRTLDGGSALHVAGRAEPGRALRVLLDGDGAGGTDVVVDAQGRWQARLDTRTLVDERVRHRVLAWDRERALASPARRVVLRRRWQLLLDQADPAGDDHGPAGSGLQLRYPTDPSWGANRQMDLRRLRVWGAADALRVELQTTRLTRSWNPPHGFDHVAFTLFVGDPARDGGARAMPLQDGELPQGMRWHWRLRAHGWSNALFAADGAGADHEGLPLAPGASFEVVRRHQRVRFTLPGALMGRTGGLQLYVTTWDYDAGYRALAAQAGGHTMGGGPGPKVMDDIGPVTLPTPRLAPPR